MHFYPPIEGRRLVAFFHTNFARSVWDLFIYLHVCCIVLLESIGIVIGFIIGCLLLSVKRKQPIVASFYPKEGRMTVRERERGRKGGSKNTKTNFTIDNS